MRLLIFLISIVIGSFCFGQKGVTAPPKMTKEDTLKAIVQNDSLTLNYVMEDFKTFSFKESGSPVGYDFVKQLIDKFYVEKKRRWAEALKQK